MDDRGVSPVVAVSLLLVMVVVAVVGFRSWLDNYSSEIMVDIETKAEELTSLEFLNVYGDQIYVKSSLTSTELLYFNILDSNYNQVCSLEKIPQVNSSVLYFQNFDENSTEEYSRYDIDVTAYGDIDCSVPGISGNACSFNASSEYLNSYPDRNYNISNSSFTYSLWFKGDISNQVYGASERVGLIFRLDNAPKIIINSSKVLVAMLRNGTSGNSQSISLNGSTVLSDDEWHYTALTFDNSTGRSVLYLNGEIEQEAVYTGNNDWWISDTENFFRLGKEDQANSRYFMGEMDEVIVYTRALSDTEISTLYEKQKAVDLDTVNIGSGIHVFNSTHCSLQSGHKYTFVLIAKDGRAEVTKYIP